MHTLSLSTTQGKCVLTATILASGMAFLDGTIVTIAIPVIQSSLNTNLAGIQWVINAYALFLAALILISGSLGDKYGRRKIFSFGIIIFIIASFLCSLSQTIEQLIVFRSLQGLGGAMMIPGSLSLIHATFQEKIHGKAIGLWSGFSGGVATIGPFIGGLLVEQFGWPSVFLINIPLGIVALVLTLQYIPESKNSESTKLDIWGTLLLFVGLLGICFALIEAPVLGWLHIIVISSLSIGIFALVAFYYHERHTKSPIISFSLFKAKRIIGANLMTLFLYFALNGVIFFLILNFQQLQHYSPLLAGSGLLPTILLITFLSGPAGGLSDKIGVKLPMVLGSLLVSVGMVSFLFAGKQANYITSFLPGLILFGIGMSFVIAPLTKTALSVDPKYSGAASGVNNAVSRVAALLAIALLGALLSFFFAQYLTSNIASTSLSSTQQKEIAIQKNKIGEIVIPDTFSKKETIVVKESIDNAFLNSFRKVMGISAFFAVLSAIIALVFIGDDNVKEKSKKRT